MADVVYSHKDIGAAVASGSFITSGMLVAPCSIKTLSGVANCFADNLELMAQAARLGAVIAPPVPAFYNRPQSLQEVVDHAVGKALDLFGIEHRLLKRWKDAGTVPLGQSAP